MVVGVQLCWQPAPRKDCLGREGLEETRDISTGQRSNFKVLDQLGEAGKGGLTIPKLETDIPGEEVWRRPRVVAHFHSLSPEVWVVTAVCLGLGTCAHPRRGLCHPLSAFCIWLLRESVGRTNPPF